MDERGLEGSVFDPKDLPATRGQVAELIRMELFMRLDTEEAMGSYLKAEEFIQEYAPHWEFLTGLMAGMVRDGASQEEYAEAVMRMAASELGLPLETFYGRYGTKEEIGKRRLIGQVAFFATSLSPADTAHVLRKSKAWVINAAIAAVCDDPIPLEGIWQFITYIQSRLLEGREGK